MPKPSGRRDAERRQQRNRAQGVDRRRTQYYENADRMRGQMPVILTAAEALELLKASPALIYIGEDKTGRLR